MNRQINCIDKLFLNGRIETLDPYHSTFQAVGVSGEVISALGDESTLMDSAVPDVEIVDLEGGALFPGLIDSHTHLMIYAYLMDGLDLAPPRIGRMADIVFSVKQEAGRRQPGEWIRGSRFVDYSLVEKRFPTRFDLDPVSPHNPVILYHTSFHACVLNSCAMEMLGFDAQTPEPAGGRIERDPLSGEPNGVLHDAAMDAIAFNHLFVPDLESMQQADRITMCSQAMQKYAESGIVAVTDAQVMPVGLGIYQDTLAAGKASVRVCAMPDLHFSQGLIQSGLKSGFGNDMLKIGAVKIFADGGMSNRMAAVKEPYQCDPFGHGLMVTPQEDLVEAVQHLHGHGFQIAVHCQGDAALQALLGAYETVLGPVSQNPLRHRIEHAGCLYPELLKRAAAMNIGVSSQPVFFSFLGDGFVDAFGEPAVHGLYPFKSMLRAGIHLGGSSDSPVSRHAPRLGLAGAVLRTSPSGRVIGPDERLTMDEALHMFTSGSAWLSFEEDIAGTLAIGKRADFTVFAQNPLKMTVEDLPDLAVKMTVLGGECTFRR
jgi:predicted amidohydrolase YtcJ